MTHDHVQHISTHTHTQHSKKPTKQQQQQKPPPKNTQGALFGLVLYGTCDLTNAALLRGWTRGLAALDMAWGSLASAVLALAQHRLHSWQLAGSCAAAL
jgi:uncharacterized membrane protein